MKVGTFNNKKHNLLALACVVSLLLAHGVYHFFSIADQANHTGASVYHTSSDDQKPDESPDQHHAGIWICNEAVLNSLNPTFQIRVDFRFVLNSNIKQNTIAEIVTDFSNIHNYKTCPIRIPSIPIVHCKLII